MEEHQDDIMNGIADNSGFVEDNVEKKKTPVLIKVVGVGGGGDNAVNHMYSQNIEGVSFVDANTDRQALNNSPVPNRLLLGPNTCEGLGAGNDPDVAKKAAEESADEIAALFNDETKMVFVTAGMGGGTGTGAAPIVARIARECGMLTIGIVTIPFLFEGQKKILKALAGADEMGKYVDALLVINNQRLTEIYPDLDFVNAFGKADDTLSVAARSIADLIIANGTMNLDFRDVNTTLRNGGVAIISTGYGEGEHRVTKAIEDALESPLLKNRDVYGSKRILVNVYINPKAKNPFKTEEVKELQAFTANCSTDVDVITGWVYDETLEDRVKITILAAGFDASINDESLAQPKRSTQSQVAEVKKAAPAPEPDPRKRLMDEYGAKAIIDQDSERAKARYVVLRLDDMDNDEIIDMLWSSPTFKRKPEFLSAIKAKQNEPKTKAPRHEEPKKGKQGTINFGSMMG